MWISNQIILDKLSFWINGIVLALDDKHWLFTWLFTVYCLAAFRDLNLRVTVAFTAGIFPVVLLFLAIRLKEVCTYLQHVRWVTKNVFFIQGSKQGSTLRCFHLWSFGHLQFHKWLRLIQNTYVPNFRFTKSLW